MVHEQLAEIDAREVNSIPVGDGIVVRVGKYGPYIQRGDDRGQVPEDLPPDELTVARAEELLGAASNDQVLGVDPATGLTVLARAGRFGPYVQLGGAEGANGAGAAAGAGVAAAAGAEAAAAAGAAAQVISVSAIASARLTCAP